MEQRICSTLRSEHDVLKAEAREGVPMRRRLRAPLHDAPAAVAHRSGPDGFEPAERSAVGGFRHDDGKWGYACNRDDGTMYGASRYSGNFSQMHQSYGDLINLLYELDNAWVGELLFQRSRRECRLLVGPCDKKRSDGAHGVSGGLRGPCGRSASVTAVLEARPVGGALADDACGASVRLVRVEAFEPAVYVAPEHRDAYERRFVTLLVDEASCRRGGVGEVFRARNPRASGSHSNVCDSLMARERTMGSPRPSSRHSMPNTTPIAPCPRCAASPASTDAAASVRIRSS